MHTHSAETRLGFTGQAAQPSFSSVWGNEMQREDFLAMAAGVRQLTGYKAERVLVADTPPYPVEHSQAAEQ
jgi:hypothetical protein